MIKAGILTISDKGSRGERVDETGPAIRQELGDKDYSINFYKIVPDEIEEIERELIYLCDELGVDLILTNGGTGIFQKRCYP